MLQRLSDLKGCLCPIPKLREAKRELRPRRTVLDVRLQIFLGTEYGSAEVVTSFGARAEIGMRIGNIQ